MRGTGRAQLYAVSLEAAALVRRERLGAILTASPRQVSLDGRIAAVGRRRRARFAFPADVVVDVLGSDVVRDARLAVVRFQPDGASTERGAAAVARSRPPMKSASTGTPAVSLFANHRARNAGVLC